MEMVYLHQRTYMVDVKAMCGTVVSNVLAAESKGEFDENVGYTSGLNAVMQGKAYIADNMQEYQKEHAKDPQWASAHQYNPLQPPAGFRSAPEYLRFYF